MGANSHLLELTLIKKTDRNDNIGVASPDSIPHLTVWVRLFKTNDAKDVVT